MWLSYNKITIQTTTGTNGTTMIFFYLANTTACVSADTLCLLYIWSARRQIPIYETLALTESLNLNNDTKVFSDYEYFWKLLFTGEGYCPKTGRNSGLACLLSDGDWLNSSNTYLTKTYTYSNCSVSVSCTKYFYWQINKII